MSTSPSPQSPLARLVLFIICLAVAGSCLAGAHYFVVDLPQQEKSMQEIPSNNNCLAQQILCLKTSTPEEMDECLGSCK